MNAQVVSALLAALLILAIGASVLLRSRSDRVYTSFAAFTFTVSAWHLCTYIGAAAESTVMSWLALWAAATIPPTAIRFFRIFLAQPSIGGPKRGPRVTLAWTLLAYAGLVYAAIVGPSEGAGVIANGELVRPRQVYEETWFAAPFCIYVFGGLYRCVFDMYMQYRATLKPVERKRVGYLALGGFVGTTLALTSVLPGFGTVWPTVGNALAILYLYFLSETLFRERLIDINELFGKMAVLGTLVVLMWAVYGFLFYWIGEQKGVYLINALVASFVILILFEPVRNRLENGVNRWLLRQRTELRARIEAVRRELPGVVDVASLVSRILTALEESRRVTDASIYLLDADGAGFDRAGYFGQAPPDRLDASAERGLLDRVRAGHLDKELIARELAELVVAPETESRHASLLALKTRMEELHAGLIFPIYGSAETEQGPWLLGLCCVRDSRTEFAFDADDLDAFRQLAISAARVIESSQAYERVKERDRLAALGEMAAGLAHEIRNPLGAIKGAAQLLITSDGKPAAGPDSAEFLEIIVEEANRLNNVVTKFLDYARAERPGRDGASKVDLNAVVRKTEQLLRQEVVRNVELRVRTDDQLPQVAGDPESLMQVFLNLGQNAMQAMPDGGTLEILTTRRRRSRLGYGQFAEVRFRDTGIGIPRDKLKKLFIPFYTTKQKGTGLGLAISHRIVNQHGGTIEVRSTIGQGSTFSVFLPAAEPMPAGKVEDITETGRLTSYGALARDPATSSGIRTPAPPEAAAVAAPADGPEEQPTAAAPLEAIPPADSMSDLPPQA